jgi:glycosyltransferase involved in cell wall biosynthesis
MRICLVSFGLEERNQRLQPWRYLLEIADTLVQNGHDVHLVSDGYPRLSKEGKVGSLPVLRLNSLESWPLRGNPKLARTVDDLRPDVVFWHLGLTSFLRLGTLKQISAPVIGVFTSPIYRPREILRLGVLRLLRGWRLSAIHVLGLLIPGILIQRVLRQGLIKQLIVECETTRIRLMERGVPGDLVHPIRPGIDPAWFDIKTATTERTRVREEFKFSTDAFVVGFFGPPVLLRGLPVLIKAIAMAREECPQINLLILSRGRNGELRSEHRAVGQLMGRLGAEQWSRMVTGFLSQEQLIHTVAACDVIALPFEVVPSDVPLSVLEAMALGVPVITTQVACLLELVPEGAGLCVAPRDPSAMAEALRVLATDASLRRGLGKAGREQAISWETSRKADAVLDRLLRSLEQ